MSMMRTKRRAASLLLCGLLLSSGAQAALIGRLPFTPGGTDYQAAYDDVLDITWLTNAGISGTATWANQVAWADNLDSLGFDDWRLATLSDTSPTTSVFNCSSGTAAACADAGNELGYMFHHNMGGSLGDNKAGIQTVDGVALTGIQSVHWSGTEFNSLFAWDFVFSFGGGNQNGSVMTNTLSGWAVRSGDVVGVPEPGTVLLMAGGVGLLGFSRKQRRR